MRRSLQLCQKVGDLTKQYSNLPESYIKRSMEQVYWKTPNKPNYSRKEIKKRKFYFGAHRPWSQEFRQDNSPLDAKKKIFIEPIKDWSFFRGDRVEVLVGKDKGKHGIIVQIFQERNWVIVEGLNCYLKTVGKDKNFPGITIKQEAPLLVTSEVALVDPTDLKSGPVEWRYTEEGEKVRVSVRTGRIIPIPKMASETFDYKTPSAYIEQPKDTTADAASQITFQPMLKTFEMDIMDKMGIKEDRVPGKTYWY
ncbi:probable 39S ribosomal protein L24, mitochondrial [Ctenocephalides felis]|uniref:probable 39S ribosomal protein L24, mitochondrial n=1 Tax=Ctenocephalides felis TaxID=7515 RepID=UPI000E6E489F|nr:probable 39S ribosomal protein L24, mitochondrial [Ctenocephalides felis]